MKFIAKIPLQIYEKGYAYHGYLWGAIPDFLIYLYLGGILFTFVL